MASIISQPFAQFADDNGKPLDGGFVYIGQPGLEPVSNPKEAFWDSDLTITAGSTLRTKMGFLYRAGTPAQAYVDGSYSITVKDHNSVTIYTALFVAGESGAVLGSMAGLNAGTGSAEFRDNGQNDARFLFRSEYTPDAASASNGAFRIINGAFTVNQTLTTGAFFTPGTVYPVPGAMSDSTRTVDRIFYGSGPASASEWSLNNNSVDIGGGFVPARTLRVQAGNQLVAGDWTAVFMRLESARTYNGQTITLFNWMKRQTAGGVSVSIRQHFGTGGSPSADVTTHIGKITVNTLWNVYKIVAAIPGVSGKTFGTNNNDYLEIVYWISAGSTYNTPTGTLGLVNTFVDFYGFHERPGNVPIEAANYYQPQDPEVETSRCMRFYQRYSGIASCGLVSDALTTNPTRGRLQFQTRMRGVPTATFTYDTGTGAGWIVSVDGATQNANHSVRAGVTLAEFQAEL